MYEEEGEDNAFGVDDNVDRGGEDCWTDAVSSEGANGEPVVSMDTDEDVDKVAIALCVH